MKHAKIFFVFMVTTSAYGFEYAGKDLSRKMIHCELKSGQYRYADVVEDYKKIYGDNPFIEGLSESDKNVYFENQIKRWVDNTGKCAMRMSLDFEYRATNLARESLPLYSLATFEKVNRNYLMTVSVPTNKVFPSVFELKVDEFELPKSLEIYPPTLMRSESGGGFGYQNNMNVCVTFEGQFDRVKKGAYIFVPNSGVLKSKCGEGAIEFASFKYKR